MSRPTAFTLTVLLFLAPALPAAPATQASTKPAATQPANDYERHAEATAALIDRVTEALIPVKDEETAKAALPKLATLKKEADALRERGMKMEKPSQEIMTAAMQKYAKRFQTAYEKCAAEQGRILQVPALEAIVGKPLAELQLFSATKVSG